MYNELYNAYHWGHIRAVKHRKLESIIITQVNIHEFKSLIERAVRDALKSQLSDATSPDGDDLLTVQQAAEFLHISAPAIYGLIHRRQLPSMKRSRRVYFKRSELLQYLEEGKRNVIVSTGHNTIQQTKNYKKTRRS